MQFIDDQTLLKLNRWLGKTSGWQLKKYVPDIHETRAGLIRRLSVDTIVDGGANVGQWASAVRASINGPKILSFEPLSAAFKELRKLSLPEHELYQLALSDSEGVAVMNVASHGGQSSSLLMPSNKLRNLYPWQNFTESVERVTSIRLDGMEQLRGKMIYLKLDVEGFERQALEGARILLEREVAAIELETSILALHEGESSHYELVNFLASFGFRPYHLFTPGVTIDGEMNCIDVIFTRR